MSFQPASNHPVVRQMLQIFMVTLLLGGALAQTPAPLAQAAPLRATFMVNTTADTVDANLGDGACADAGGNCSLRAAISQANSTLAADTIILEARTYQLTLTNGGNINEDNNDTGDLDINSSMTIVGAGAGSTFIQAGTNTSNGIDKVFGVNPTCASGVHVTLDGVTIRFGYNTQPTTDPMYSFTGGGLDWCGGSPPGTFTLRNSIVSDNTNVNGYGGGMNVDSIVGSTIVTIDNVEFINNRTLSTTTTSNGGALNLWNATVNISNSTFQNNSVPAAVRNGGAINLNNGSLTVVTSLFSANTAAAGSAIYINSGTATIHYNRIVNNTPASSALAVSGGTVNATENWWGCSTGPSAGPCDRTNTANYTPWLRDQLTSGAGTTLVTNQTSTLTASFLTNSSGGAVAVSNLTQLIGLPVAWNNSNAAVGSLSGAQGTIQGGGTAAGTFTATAPGSTTLYAQVDNDNTAPANSNVLGLTVNKANTTTAITSHLPDPSTPGQAVTVAFTVTGQYGNTPVSPTGNVTVTDGVDSCTGTIAVGSCAITLSTPGVRTLTATYAGDLNFNPSPVSAGVPHTVNQAPAITSADTTTLTVGSAGTFTVTTTGFPSGASMSISAVGALPSGVTFTDNGNGTAALAGTPAAGTGGTYPITITANNGVLPNDTQIFTLTVNQAPAITSANTTTFTETLAGSFTVTTSGFPTGASMLISEVGALPSGVTFTDNRDGTATLSGTPAVGTLGNYPITITADNGILPSATQNFTLVVEPNLRITSADNTTFTVGSAGSFTVTTTGVPIPTLSRGGSLPGGVTFVDNGDGTGTLSGTPASGTAGTYPITFTASNGVAPDDVQNFTLTVNQVPAITSGNNTAFTIGGAGSFTVTTTGFPTGASMSISEAGALPGGVTFTDNGDGTATLAGTPTAGTVGTYPITFTASNGVAPDATQNFTLTVNQASTTMAITSDAPDPSIVGQTVTFNYTVSVVAPGGGTPTGNVTVSNGTDSCTATVADSSCTIIFTAPSASNFIATYAGNANYAGSASATEAHTVNQAATTTTITSDAPDPSIVGQTVTFNYAVSVAAPGTGTPTGNVTVSNGTDSCTAIVAAGSCAITFTASGTSNFTATYMGDTDFAGSTSAIEAHTVNQAATTTTITSDAPDPSIVGQTVTFNYTVTVVAPGGGTPTGSVTASNGTQSCTGTLSAGSCTITFTAPGTSNFIATYSGDKDFAVSTSAIEPHTVNQSPAITSMDNTGFEVGVAGSFTVTTTGFPVPGIFEAGALPAGVTFTDNGDGTATLSGTPAAGTGGMYNLTFTASNGVSPNATQNFTLTVGQVPAITSANNVTFTVGSAGSFTVTTTGFPIPALTRGGAALPGGVSFTDNGDGTATLSGTPAAGTGGIYNLTFTASNGVLPNDARNFTLTINQPPAITSANNTAFTVGAAGSFTVTTTGFPIPGIVETGALPGGVTFTDNGNGTGTLSGTPAAGTGGMYNLTFTASNGVLPNATQTFTLTVGEAPAITSPNNVAFVAGNLSSFTITTTGAPTPALSSAGALPSGIGFTDNGNGTATLSGTPALGSVGTYTLTFIASNGVAPNATQNFTLTIDGPPGVSRINSSADTGDGQVLENEHTGVTITQLLVVFNKDMQHTDPTDFADVQRPLNYTLIQDGSTTITIDSVSYNPATFTVTLSINSGIALPNGRYTLTVEGDIEDTLGVPIGTDFVRVFYVDNAAPTLTSVVTIQGDAALTNGATINVGFSSLDVTFNEEVSDPAGNADPDDVTNPANYLLIAPGPNGAFDTLNCTTGLTGDDVQIPVGPVTYRNGGGTGPFVATVRLNNGAVLPNGTYRLYVCGTTSIVDLASNPLNGGADDQRTFTVLLLNAAARRNPQTGFAPGVVTMLPEQPTDKAYADLGNLWIEIPKFKLKTTITGVPLTGDGWDVTWLHRQVGWLEGTAYPTWEGNTVLTAHGYTADGEAGPFALLKNLSYGDKIIIHFNGMKYTYAVRTNLLVSPNDTRLLTKHEEQDWITLITCQQYDDKIQAYRYRRVVRAVLANIEQE